ncbi:MAG: glycosyltransferase [Nitrospinales bacterium]
MHRVLLITKRYYTNKDIILDRFGRLFHLPMQLVQHGYTFMVITGNYQSNKIETYDISGLQFLSLPFTIRKFAFVFYRFWQSIQQFRPDIIVASGDIHFGIFGLIYAKLAGVPFVFDVYDDYTQFRLNRLSVMKLLFWKIIRKSDAVICSSKPLRDKLYQKTKSIAVIQNGVDTKLFKPISRRMARNSLSIDQNDTVIGYFGYMGTNYGIDILIDALKKIKNFYPRVRLLLAGKKAYDIDLNQPYIDYRGVVDQKEIPLFINSSDVVVIPYLADGQISVSNPCKLSEYLACGVPIVATRVSDIAQTLSDIPEALCKPGDIDEMERALKFQLETPTIAKLPDSLTWESLGKKFRNVLESLSAQHPI